MPAAAATHRNKKLLVVGQSTTAPMRAAKQLNLPKSVYCVRKIDARHTAEQLQEYLPSVGVKVVSCYDRTLESSRYAKNKIFQICVYDADKEEFLCADNWATGVSIQQWKFKQNPAGSNTTAATQATAAAMDGPPEGGGRG